MLSSLSFSFPRLSQGGSVDVAAAVAIIAGIIGLAIYSISLNDRPYSGFPMVAAQAGKKLQDAKKVWVGSAKSLIYDTLKKVILRITLY